jgi:hypothetical protein
MLAATAASNSDLQAILFPVTITSSVLFFPCSQMDGRQATQTGWILIATATNQSHLISTGLSTLILKIG